MLMFVSSRPLSQRRGLSIQQQQNPESPIVTHRSLDRTGSYETVRQAVQAVASYCSASVERIQRTHPLFADLYSSTVVLHMYSSQSSQ